MSAAAADSSSRIGPRVHIGEAEAATLHSLLPTTPLSLSPRESCAAVAAVAAATAEPYKTVVLPSVGKKGRSLPAQKEESSHDGWTE
jgi:hypothetical protein